MSPSFDGSGVLAVGESVCFSRLGPHAHIGDQGRAVYGDSQRLPCPLPAPRGDVPRRYVRAFGGTASAANATPSRRSVARERPTCQDKSCQAVTRVGRYRRATAPDRNSRRSTGSSWMRSRRPASNVGPVSGKDRLHKELVLVDQSQICQRQGERHATHPQALA